ncbi:MAG: hypothetical protein K0R17_1417 [Rariglobus sp.]|jgi:ElaB/YqjD/DUF883 family membrane-anchored ribosome-binding protein|nr:hypothetical protein [Rariglobus sp.]
MKSQSDSRPDETEAIRAEIDTTRHRMGETIDALGRRLKGRHLLDEALHLLRKQQENGNMTKLKNRISESAGTAYHSVVDTIKSNPVPVALVGAGVGWIIYERVRSQQAGSEIKFEENRTLRPYENAFSPGAAAGACGGPISESQGWARSGASSAGGKVSRAAQAVQQKATEIRDRLRETGIEAGEKTRQVYEKGRERVTTAVEEHPLQSGLAFLALGVVAGLLLPTPQRMRARLEPKARELSERVQEKARDLVNRGSQVVKSATEAARQEAKAQGLTSDKGKSGQSSEEKVLTPGAVSSA